MLWKGVGMLCNRKRISSSTPEEDTTPLNLDLSHKGITAMYLMNPVNLKLYPNFDKVNCLNMGYNDLGNTGAQLLSVFMTMNKDLKCLDLSFNNIGDAGMKHICEALKSNASLEILFLNGNLVSGVGAEYLGHALESNITLTTLYLSGNTMGADGFRHVSNALCVNSSLRALTMSGNKGEKEGAAHLSKCLLMSKALKYINISDNRIGDIGLQSISEALHHQKTIKTLELSFNSITHASIEGLAYALWNYTSMHTLLLDNNKLGDAGAKLLSQCISSMNLTHLNVGFNDIGAAGVMAILHACLFPINSSSMSVLNISGSVVSTEVARLLADLLVKNRTLTQLHLDKTNIGAIGERYIAAGIASNRQSRLVALTGFNLGEVLMTLDSPSVLGTMSNSKALMYLAEMWRTHHGKDAYTGTSEGVPSSNCSTSVEDDDVSLSIQSPAVPHHTDDLSLHSMRHELSHVDSHSNPARQQSPPATNSGSTFKANTLMLNVVSAEQGTHSEHFHKYAHALREVAYLPFIAADLWSLHQYYFSPATRAMGDLAEADGSTSESENDCASSPGSHTLRGLIQESSDRPKKRQGNRQTMARIAGYPRLKNLLENYKSEDSNERMLVILRQLKFLEDNADDLNDFDLESALIESL